MEDEETTKLSIRNFITARVQEITSLSLGLRGTSSKGLAFQHVPKHMRRRAVSHDPRRLPSRIRVVHLNQLKKSTVGGIVKKKLRTPSRKFRRRKSNLLQEYNRRQQKNKWIETHIWHAKRFKMEAKWGYKIPLYPCEKGFRSLYRGAMKHCVMRDISFYSCIQLSGSFTVICENFRNHFVHSEVNTLGIGAEMFSTGEREGSIDFYSNNTYPYGYIGKVKFLWNKNRSELWMWVHPAQKEEIILELCEVFELESILPLKGKKITKPTTNEMGKLKTKLKGQNKIEGNQTKGKVIPNDEAEMSVNEIKLIPKALKNPAKWTNLDDTITLVDLEGALNRIRLHGPLCTSVLKSILYSTVCETIADKEKQPSTWWEHFYKDNPSLLEKQSRMWNALEEFNQVPCNTVIPLTVKDPRVFLSKKRGKLTANTESLDSLDQSFDRILEEYNKVAVSPLWNSEIRSKVLEEKMSDAEFSKRRSELLIPGSTINLGRDENQIPVLLIHRTGHGLRSSEFGGWDLVVPAGWTMSFWVALSYRAVRVGGLRDAVHYDFEAGSIHTAEFVAPDSISGVHESKEEEKNLRDLHFKQPPAKRPNFQKLGCPFPFEIDWKTFLHFWTKDEDIEKYYILRSCSALKSISSLFKHNRPYKEDFCQNLNIPIMNTCLVGVRVVMKERGNVCEGAVICIPELVDIQQFTQTNALKLKCSKQNGTPIHSEPFHEDKNEERVELREKHQKFMALLRKKRKKVRKREGAEEEIEPYDSTQLSKSFNDQMNRLWLPSDSNIVLENMSRRPLGFIVHGGESYVVGKCAGLGFSPLIGLIGFIKETQSWNPSRLVLIRCRNNFTYRFAQLEVSELPVGNI